MIYSPLVSIIIPVYNVEQYLPETLDSVLVLSYHNWECICVNDGSPDNSATILAEYEQRDARITVITQDNTELSGARNKGLRLMKGDYVYFFYSDDVLPSNAVAQLVSLAEQHQADVVEASHSLFTDDGSITWQPWRADWAMLADKVYRGGARPHLLRDVGPFACMKLIRTSLLSENALCFDESLKYAEDFPFTATLVRLSQVYVTSSASVLRYRQSREGSLMSSPNYVYLLNYEYKAIASMFRDWRMAGRIAEVQDELLEICYYAFYNRASQLKIINFSRNYLRALLLSLKILWHGGGMFSKKHALLQYKRFYRLLRARLRWILLHFTGKIDHYALLPSSPHATLSIINSYACVS